MTVKGPGDSGNGVPYLTPVGDQSDYQISRDCRKLFEKIIKLENECDTAETKVNDAETQYSYEGIGSNDIKEADGELANVRRELGKANKTALKVLKGLVEGLDVDKSFQAIYQAVNSHKKDAQWDRKVQLEVIPPKSAGMELRNISKKQE